MSEADRDHWDGRYSAAGMAALGEMGPPPAFTAFEHLFPSSGRALELACGRGRGAMWLADLGLKVLGIDVSAVAIELARNLALLNGIADRCRFDVADLDDGLPHGRPVDVIMLHLYWDERLAGQIVERLAPGGLLAVATQSEADVGPGVHRLRVGELTGALGGLRQLETLEAGEEDGKAWYFASRL